MFIYKGVFDSMDLTLASDSEVENTTRELKQVEKLNNPNGLDDILKIIVGMANRDGGYIYIGVKDNGEPQGKGIFEQFSKGEKSGVDKVKEEINGKCLSNTSPVVEIDMDIISSDEYDILKIIIPKKKTIPHAVIKRKGNYIESRKYYIKTSHNCTLVSDSQLEWLFNSRDYENKIDCYNIQATTYKFMGGIPIASGIDKLGDWLIIQPEVTREAAQVIHDIFQHGEDVKNKLKDSEYRMQLFSEILLHTIIRTIDGYGSRCIPKDAKFLPSFPDDFLLCEILRENSKVVFENVFMNKISLPSKTKVKYFKGEDGTLNCLFFNDHFDIKVSLFLRGFKLGIYGSNPYFSTMLSTHLLEFQRQTEDYYESYDHLVSVEVERKFPAVFDNVYYESVLFIERIRKSIKYNWDIDHFLKEQYPHYRRLYSIDCKLDQLINRENNKVNRKNNFFKKIKNILLRK